MHRKVERHVKGVFTNHRFQHPDLAEAAAQLKDGVWTKEAEEALLKKAC